jgi:hypothetical protein
MLHIEETVKNLRNDKVVLQNRIDSLVAGQDVEKILDEALVQ